MRWLRDISIDRKVFALQITSSVLIVLICIGLFTWYDYNSFKSSKEKQLLSISHVIAGNLESPLMFQDSDAAKDILTNLDFDRAIKYALVRDAQKSSFVEYGKNPSGQNLTKNRPQVVYQDDCMTVSQPVIKDGEMLGDVIIITDLDDVNQHFWGRMKYAGVILLFAILLGAVFGFVLRRYLSQPIIELQNTMDNVIRYNDFKVRAKDTRKDELGQISKVFNNLLQKIELHDRLLSKANADLEDRVEKRTNELKIKNEKLELASAEAEKSKMEKEQFLASMSHEIRTPLNAIIGFSDLLMLTKLSEEQQEYLRSIDFAGKNLLGIINDILDLSKIESGKLEFENRPFDVRETVQSIVEMVSFRAQKGGNKINVLINDDVPQVIIGDEKRLIQILINLVGNAVKFTENGNITIRLINQATEDDSVLLEFQIEDTGVGIAKENLESIFHRFIQEQSDKKAKIEGTGLGLAIVKELVELQNGHVWVRSELNLGSTFFFELWFDTTEEETQSHANAKTVSDVSVLNNLNVLLAEDIRLNQQLVAKIVSQWNVNLTIVNNGLEAINKVKNQQFDVILMDIQMPVMDGYTAASKIRLIQPSVPIVALTAHVTQKVIQKSKEQGMSYYLSKPFRMNQLRDLLISIKTNDSSTDSEVNFFDNGTSKDYDLSRLKENADGDSAFFFDMLSTFEADVPMRLNELKEAINKNDKKRVHEIGHALTGVFASFGMQSSITTLEQIVKEVDNDNGSLANQLFKNLQLRVSQIMTDFSNESI